MMNKQMVHIQNRIGYQMMSIVCRILARRHMTAHVNTDINCMTMNHRN